MVGINSRTMVVNTTGVAVKLPWLDNVPALLQTWYDGQEFGNAVLDVTFGEVISSRKLPITYLRENERTKCFSNFLVDSFEPEEVD